MTKEKCVVCNEDVDVDVKTHVDFRDFYVEGCGQLCRECYSKTYGKEFAYDYED